MKTGRSLTTGILTLLLIAGFAISSQAQFEKQITTQPFTTIEAGGMLKIYLIPSDTHEIRIESEKPIDEVLEMEVDDGALEIESKWDMKDRSWKQDKLEVYISFIELREIESEGMVKIDSKDGVLVSEKLSLELQGATKTNLKIDVEKLESEVSGAAQLELSGKARMHSLEGSGAANIKAYELQTEKTDVEVSGASMAYVNASEKLTGSKRGVAQINYEEAPAVVEIDKTASMERMVEKSTSRNKYEDSVKVKVGKFDVQVIDSDTTIIKMGRSQIRIDDDGNVEIGQEKLDREFDGHWSGFYLGVNGYMTEDNNLTLPDEYKELDLTYEKSINVQLNIFEQNFNLIRERFGLVTGLGFEWNNYRFDNDVVLVDGDDGIDFKQKDPEKTYEKSKLVVSYLTLPLLFEFQTNSDNDISSFHIAAGAAGGLRIGSHSKNVIDGDKNKQRSDFHMNPFKLDGMVRIGWGKLNLYAAYDVVPLFKDDKGPELYPFNVGVQILGL